MVWKAWKLADIYYVLSMGQPSSQDFAQISSKGRCCYPFLFSLLNKWETEAQAIKELA